MSSATLSVKLQPEMLARIEELARRERRTTSDLVSEALRQYESAQWWQSVNAYGREKATERGLTESDVVSAVADVRKRRCGGR